MLFNTANRMFLSSNEGTRVSRADANTSQFSYDNCHALGKVNLWSGSHSSAAGRSDGHSNWLLCKGKKTTTTKNNLPIIKVWAD